MQMGSWKNWFQPHILERGRTCFDEGRVSELEHTEDGYVAVVEGTEEYEVELLLGRDAVEDIPTEFLRIASKRPKNQSHVTLCF